jgi:hypothetical protein
LRGAFCHVVLGPGITLTGGPAPVRAYIDELMPDILEPGKVFHVTTGMDDISRGLKDMDERRSLKVLIKPRPPA